MCCTSPSTERLVSGASTHLRVLTAACPTLSLCPACLPALQGYVNPKMERLRKGIGPEHIDLVEYIAPGEVPGLLREELLQLKE